MEKKGACRQVSTPMLMLVSESGGYVRKGGKSEVYLEGDALSPLYRREEH